MGLSAAEVLKNACDILAQQEETEHTWSSMDDEMRKMLEWFQDIEEPENLKERHDAIHLLVSGSMDGILHAISRCIASERSRLSGTALELVQSVVVSVSKSSTNGTFPERLKLVDSFLPSIFKLTQRANKVFVNRSFACLENIMTNYPVQTSIKWIHTQKFTEMMRHANKNVRMAVIQCLLNILDLVYKNVGTSGEETRETVEQYIDDILECLNIGVHDATPDVRSKSIQSFQIFEKIFQEEANQFLQKSSPRMQKILKFNAASGNKIMPINAERSQSRESIRKLIAEKQKVQNLEPFSAHFGDNEDQNMNSIKEDIYYLDIKSPSPPPFAEVETPHKPVIAAPAKVLPPPPQRLGNAIRVVQPSSNGGILSRPVQPVLNRATPLVQTPQRTIEKKDTLQKPDGNVESKTHNHVASSIKDPNWSKRAQAIANNGLHTIDDFLEAISDHHPRVVDATLDKMPHAFNMLLLATPNKQAQLVLELLSHKRQNILEAFLEEFQKMYSSLSCASMLSLACGLTEPHQSYRKTLVSLIHQILTKQKDLPCNSEIDGSKSNTDQLSAASASVDSLDTTEDAVSVCSRMSEGSISSIHTISTLESTTASKSNATLQSNAFKIILAKLPWVDRHHATDKNLLSLFKEIILWLYNNDARLFLKCLPVGSQQAARDIIGITGSQASNDQQPNNPRPNPRLLYNRLKPSRDEKSI
jgi:hypothetical protein